MDRMCDLYLTNQIGTIFFDGMKPLIERNPAAVAQARGYIDTMYQFLEKDLTSKTWLLDTKYSMADLSALAGLFYAKTVHPFDNKSLLLLKEIHSRHQRYLVTIAD